MVSQENLKKIAKLTEKISWNYLENLNSRDINGLKEKLKDFLINSLWDDESIFQLKNIFTDLELNDDELKEVWQRIEKKIESTYSNFLERTPHLFEGKTKEYEDRLIDFFVKAGELKGQNQSFSTIIGYFLIHKNLTQTQLKELTGFSKGTVSTILNNLEEYGFLKKRLIKGTRKFLYTFGRDFSELSLDTGAFKKEINQIATHFFLVKLEELNKHKNKKGYEFLSERINGVMNFLKIHKRLIDHIMDSDFMKNIINGKI